MTIDEGCRSCKNESVYLGKDGCCKTCSALLKKISDTKSRKNIPSSLEGLFSYGDENEIIEKYIGFIRDRLRLMRDEYVEQEISAHQLELRLSQVSFLAIKKPIPKCNDMIATNLGAKERLFMYQLLTGILLNQKPDYINKVIKQIS